MRQTHRYIHTSFFEKLDTNIQQNVKLLYIANIILQEDTCHIHMRTSIALVRFQAPFQPQPLSTYRVAMESVLLLSTTYCIAELQFNKPIPGLLLYCFGPGGKNHNKPKRATSDLPSKYSYINSTCV